MKILFIGGTGIISTACTQLAAERGMEVTLVTRGQHETRLSPGVKSLVADVHDVPSALKALEGKSFDAVVDWIVYTLADIERSL